MITQGRQHVFSKLSNPIVLSPSENDLHETPDVEFKGMNENMFKWLKQDTNISQGTQTAVWNKKTIHDMKLEFNKDKEILKETQTKMMVKCKAQ